MAGVAKAPSHLPPNAGNSVFVTSITEPHLDRANVPLVVLIWQKPVASRDTIFRLGIMALGGVLGSGKRRACLGWLKFGQHPFDCRLAQRFRQIAVDAGGKNAFGVAVHCMGS